MLLISVGVTVPSLLGPVEPTIGRGWWIAVFVLFLASLVLATALEHGPIRLSGFGTAVVTAWIVVLTAQSTGLILVLLVVTAATSVHIVPLRVGLAIVGLNTVVIAVVTLSRGITVAEGIVLIGFYLLIQLASTLSSVTLIREQQLRRELTEAHVELKAASILLSESARTAERLRISRELHDIMGHQLTVLTLQLETARHLDGEASRLHLERADRVARELLGDVRETVGRLRTEAPDLELALKSITENLPGLAVSIDIPSGVQLGEEARATIVRAVQEIVTNTVRHAQARELRIAVRPAQGGVELDARDDGRGTREVVLGNGLRGLRERVSALGGDVMFDGSNGFRVHARIADA